MTLNGTSGDLTAGANAVGLTKSFTVSAWANPSVASGSQTLLDQDGSAYAGLWLGTSGTAWMLSLNTGPGSSGTFDTITGGSVDPGEWSQVTATYDAGTAVMRLYVDGNLVAYAHHAPRGAARPARSTWAAPSPAAVGSSSSAGRWPRCKPGTRR